MPLAYRSAFRIHPKLVARNIIWSSANVRDILSNSKSAKILLWKLIECSMLEMRSIRRAVAVTRVGKYQRWLGNFQRTGNTAFYWNTSACTARRIRSLAMLVKIMILMRNLKPVSACPTSSYFSEVVAIVFSRETRNCEWDDGQGWRIQRICTRWCWYFFEEVCDVFRVVRILSC